MVSKYRQYDELQSGIAAKRKREYNIIFTRFILVLNLILSHEILYIIEHFIVSIPDKIDLSNHLTN
jgi:hypothetical protein